MQRLKDRPISEAEITKSIREYLKLTGVFHYKQWQGLGSLHGISDIIGIYLGLTFFLEVKTKTGKLSPNQKDFLVKVNYNGGFGVVVRSVDNVIEIFEGIKNGKDLSILRAKFSD